jgi:hypothetical protein
LGNSLKGLLVLSLILLLGTGILGIFGATRGKLETKISSHFIAPYRYQVLKIKRLKLSPYTLWGISKSKN